MEQWSAMRKLATSNNIPDVWAERLGVYELPLTKKDGVVNFTVEPSEPKSSSEQKYKIFMKINKHDSSAKVNTFIEYLDSTVDYHIELCNEDLKKEHNIITPPTHTNKTWDVKKNGDTIILTFSIYARLQHNFDKHDYLSIVPEYYYIDKKHCGVKFKILRT